MPTKGRGEVGSRPRPKLKPKLAAADRVPVSLRIPKGVLTRVDALVKARKVENPIARTTWLLEAVNEKLNRDEKKGEEKE